MKKDYRISRNIRASWFFRNLNSVLEFSPETCLVSPVIITHFSCIIMSTMYVACWLINIEVDIERVTYMFTHSNYSGIIYRKSDLYERCRNMPALELISPFWFLYRRRRPRSWQWWGWGWRRRQWSPSGTPPIPPLQRPRAPAPDSALFRPPSSISWPRDTDWSLCWTSALPLSQLYVSCWCVWNWHLIYITYICVLNCLIVN